MQTDDRGYWVDHLDHEVSFWERRIGGDPEGFQARFQRPSPTNELLPGLVALLPSEHPTLLDVGSGPAPVVIGSYPKPVAITACDPLADDYRRLLDQTGVTSPLQLIAVDGEHLVEHFGGVRFDITHIQNALDHSYNPVQVVRNMVECTKPGGAVVIRSVINEGSNQHFHGLHQWNISPGASDFYIANKDGDRTSMRDVLGDDIDRLLVASHLSLYGGKLQHWMDVVLVKRGASGETIRAVEDHFGATQVGIGRAMLVEWRQRDTERKELRAERNALRTERNALRERLTRARQKQAALTSSRTYQLSRALARAGKSPRRIVLFPRDVLRSLRSAERSPRKRADGAV